MPENIPEDKLITALLNKEEAAFRYLYENYAAAFNGIISRLITDTQLAEDLLQDSIIRIWEKIHLYDAKKGRLFTWMIRLVRNVCVDELRSKAYRNLARTGEETEQLSNSGRHSSTPDLYDAIGLRKQLLKLRAADRDMIELVYFSQLSQSEIAALLRMPIGTVKTRIKAAVNALQLITTDCKRKIVYRMVKVDIGLAS